MKARKFLFLILGVSLLLTACENEDGFSITRNYEESAQTPTMGDDLKQEDDDNKSNSGATGVGRDDDDKDDVQIEDDDTGTSSGLPTELDDTPVVDLGNQVTIFKCDYVKCSEEMYININFDYDPFDAKYDFAYYTVNEKKLDQADYRNKEIVDEVVTYKIFLGTNEAGTYVLKFYNSEDVQYGKMNVTLKKKAEVSSPLYINVAFNLIKVRVVAISFTVQSVFKKIGDFFSNLFSGDRIAL